MSREDRTGAGRAYYEQLRRREEAIPRWVRSVFTTRACTLTPELEDAMLAEFVERFGDVLTNLPEGRTRSG